MIAPVDERPEGQDPQGLEAKPASAAREAEAPPLDRDSLLTQSRRPSVDEGLIITQADREAAADAVRAYRGVKGNNWQARIRLGECDDGEMVQLFARHRLNASSATEAEKHLARGHLERIDASLRRVTAPEVYGVEPRGGEADYERGRQAGYDEACQELDEAHPEEVPTPSSLPIAPDGLRSLLEQAHSTLKAAWHRIHHSPGDGALADELKDLCADIAKALSPMLTAAPQPPSPGQGERVFEARHCPGIPTDCCDFGVISHATGKEVCRVWEQDDAELIARLLNGAVPPSSGEAEAVARRDELRDVIIAAYAAGARDVHSNWQEDSDPDFTEAAHDYAADALSPKADGADHG